MRRCEVADLSNLKFRKYIKIATEPLNKLYFCRNCKGFMDDSVFRRLIIFLLYVPVIFTEIFIVFCSHPLIFHSNIGGH